METALALLLLCSAARLRDGPVECQPAQAGMVDRRCLAVAMHDSTAFLASRRFNRGFDTDQIVHSRWFKPLLLTYWTVNTVDTYRSHGNARVQDALYRDSGWRTVAISSEGVRVAFVARSIPFVTIRAFANRNREYALLLYPTHRGVVVSLAIGRQNVKKGG